MEKGKWNLTTKMLLALILGIFGGIGMIGLREMMIRTANQSSWQVIDLLLFADISQNQNGVAIGLFYIIGQLFVKALQLVIIPMVFTSIILAMVRISDTKRLGRISYKTISYFFCTTLFAVVIAIVVGMMAYRANLFLPTEVNMTIAQGKMASHPLFIILDAVPSNLVTAFGNNKGVLAIVVSAVLIGICINQNKEKITFIIKLCQEINMIITTFLNLIICKFGPVAIFCLIMRTCASYGISYLKPAMVYMILTVVLLLFVLLFGYALFVKFTTGLNPFIFMKKTLKVALFGFSTSSSAATLPLNLKTTINDLGVNSEIAFFVLPLGMTINMDGTAMMQVIATIFIAGCSGYPLSFSTLLLIAVLAIISSIGTPAAPGAGAIILFTILSGIGIQNESALLTYSLILAINRPIEMLVTALNVVGDSACSIAVSNSEGLLDRQIYVRNIR